MDTQLRDREQLKNREQLLNRKELRDDLIGNQGICHHLKSMSWSAVFTGALVGIGISFIFNLFAMAIGLTAFATTTTSLKTIAIGGVIGLLLISIFSMGTAGWVAGYLGRPRSLHRDMGVIYGFTAWCLALVLMVVLSTNFGKFISYNVAALQNPTYFLTNVDNTMSVTTSGLTTTNANNPQTLNTNQNVMNTQDATKTLALTTFLAFVLAFVGAIASCIGGHWGFRSSEKDILYYKDRDRDHDIRV